MLNSVKHFVALLKTPDLRDEEFPMQSNDSSPSPPSNIWRIHRSRQGRLGSAIEEHEKPLKGITEVR
jgi:hypothetical protein